MRAVLALALFLAPLIVAVLPSFASAQEEVVIEETVVLEITKTRWGVALGAGIAIGLAGLGCGIGQGLAGSGAVQGIARNPGAAAQIQTPMIIALVLIESIALYGFVIAALLVFVF